MSKVKVHKRVDFIVLATVVGVSLARSRVPLLPVPPRLPLRGAGGDRAISTPRLPMPAGWRLPRPKSTLLTSSVSQATASLLESSSVGPI